MDFIDVQMPERHSKLNIKPGLYSICGQFAGICIPIKSAIIKFTITKTYLYNIDPLKPHCYIIKIVYIIFLITAKNIDSGY